MIKITASLVSLGYIASNRVFPMSVFCSILIVRWKGWAFMNWLGSDPKVAREMDLDDIFQCRIQLLVIMASNYLCGVPLGEHQRRAMEHNARHIESECCLFSDSPAWRKQIDHYDRGNSLCRRLKLLCRMITAVARGVSIGDHRKQIMRENLSAIDKLIGGNAWERNAITIRMLRLHR